uniref:Protein BUD31 homolog n=1 Tax=Strigamia maritima TaxID=126957 RepID=T1IPB7_STRMM
MPKVRRSKKAPPDGWELIEPTLDDLKEKMREAQVDPNDGKRRVEALWPIFKIHHQRTRYIYDLFYRRKAISRELYDYCIKENIADKNLIAKWKKQGYENLCCLQCIQTRDTNFGTNCICRVPKNKLEEGKIVECVFCGCRGERYVYRFVCDPDALFNVAFSTDGPRVHGKADLNKDTSDTYHHPANIMPSRYSTDDTKSTYSTGESSSYPHFQELTPATGLEGCVC